MLKATVCYCQGRNTNPGFCCPEPHTLPLPVPWAQAMGEAVFSVLLSFLLPCQPLPDHSSPAFLIIASIWPACCSYSLEMRLLAAAQTAARPHRATPETSGEREGTCWGLSMGNPARVAAPGVWHPQVPARQEHLCSLALFDPPPGLPKDLIPHPMWRALLLPCRQVPATTALPVP